MPEPHVIDAALWDRRNDHLLPRRKEIMAVLPRAKRFILSDEASTRVGEILKGEEMAWFFLRNHQFAIPPYPVTYIEFNIDNMLITSGRRIYKQEHSAARDIRTGYLINSDGERAVVYPFAKSADGIAGPSPVILRKGSKKVIPLPAALGPTPPRARLNVLLGSDARDARVSPSNALAAEEILGRWTLDYMMPNHADKYDIDFFNSCAGDFRNLVVLLLLLNQPKLIGVTPIARSSGIRKGKRVVYAAHNVVDIRIGEKKDYRRVFDFGHGTRSSPRRHNVRGHFVHYHRDPNCIHSWPSEADTTKGHPSWTCGKCGCVRVWRKTYEKGDATKGFVTKDYSLT